MSRRRVGEWEQSQFIVCYAWGHALFPYPNSEWRPEFATDYIVLRCERCGTERRDAYGTMTGELTLRYYDYPLGYNSKSYNDPKPTKGELRLMATRQQRRDQRATANVVRLPQRRNA